MYLNGRWILQFWDNSMFIYPFCASFATEVMDLSFCLGFRWTQTLAFLQIDFFKAASEVVTTTAWMNFSITRGFIILKSWSLSYLSFHSSVVQPWCFHRSLGNLIKYSKMTFPIFPILRCMCFLILIYLN